jgi:phage-related protein
MNAKIDVDFYQEPNGNEPVRKWLKGLDKNIRLIIGEDLKRIQHRWPTGKPLVGFLTDGLFELRSTLPNGIARIIFIVNNNKILLLHGFIKKTEQTPKQDLDLAKKRAKNVKELKNEKRKKT